MKVLLGARALAWGVIASAVSYIAYRGPKMAVAAYFSLDDWDWQARQWDRVIAAGTSVRLVVADQAYSEINRSTDMGSARVTTMQSKFDLCHAARQRVFGYVYGAGGLVRPTRDPGDPPGTTYPDPLHPENQVRAVADQVDLWHQLYGQGIDGIYVDEGPQTCSYAATGVTAHPEVPGNYQAYVNHIRQYGYEVYLLAAQWLDNDPQGNPWLQNFNPDYIAVFEGMWHGRDPGVSPYRDQYGPLNYCSVDRERITDPSWPGDEYGGQWPPWWDAGIRNRYRRVHIINDCQNEGEMREIARLAWRRGAGTIWITLADAMGRYSQLPPYWDAEVAYFSRPLFGGPITQ